MNTGDPAPYPVRVDAVLEPASRWLWLVKWLLVLPHLVVLAFLWLGFVVLTVVAFVAILVTGRYPRGLFDYNLGVLRWTWRVQYYAYAALGTDRYPPFTLAEVPDYPAHLSIDYPERLSRGLVLVKWWLLAIPHYLVVALFAGGGTWFVWRADGTATGDQAADWGAGGLIGVLVLVAAVVLLVTGRYPRPVYDFVLGMDRWVIRVGAYAGLMTDRYPPFRLDMGGTDPGGLPVAASPPPTAPVTATRPPAAAAVRPHGSAWTAGRVVALVLGAMLALASTGLLAAGGGLLWADQTQRDADGYLSTPVESVRSAGHAVTLADIDLGTGGADWLVNDILGTARLRVTPEQPGTSIFIGIAPTDDAAAYLRGVAHSEVDRVGPMSDATPMMGSRMSERSGGPPASPPGDLGSWVAQADGAGTQTVSWPTSEGNWTVVVMRADGAAGVDVSVQAAATVPGLPWLAAGLLAVGVVLLAAGALLVGLAVHRAGSDPSPEVLDRAAPAPRSPAPGPRTPAPVP